MHSPATPPKDARRNESGITLVEVVIVLALGVMVTTVITLVVTAGLRNTRSAKRFERLHANMLFVTDSLAYWVKQSDLLTVTTTAALKITLPDSSVKYIEKTGNRVTLDGNALTTDDAQVTSLVFTKLARSVRLNVAFRARDGAETLSVTTTVAQRNSF